MAVRKKLYVRKTYVIIYQHRDIDGKYDYKNDAGVDAIEIFSNQILPYGAALEKMRAFASLSALINAGIVLSLPEATKKYPALFAEAGYTERGAKVVISQEQKFIDVFSVLEVGDHPCGAYE